MMERIVRFSIKRPKFIVGRRLVLLFGSQLPRAKTDTDPKHMLPATSPVRVNNDKVEERFELHADWIVLGVVNESGLEPQYALQDSAHHGRGRHPRRIAYDIVSFTADNVGQGAGPYACPLMPVPTTSGETVVPKVLYENPMFVDRLISKDGTTTAIYIPPRRRRTVFIADRVRALFEKETNDGMATVSTWPAIRLRGTPSAR